jgi:fructose-1,6-bisphosphatase/inositol monophosphatase family enzyme
MLPIEVNGPMIGIFLKELVRRAMIEIRNQRFAFEATVKRGYGGKMDDVFTTADTNAQAIFSKAIREALPGVGILGEEGLREECTLPGCDIYITLDPLDGTKAFIRRQSHGVGTMVAMVIDGEIISAWIGDVNTLEIFGFRPGSPKVHRISEFEFAEDLTKIKPKVSLANEYILLRKGTETFPPAIVSAVRHFKKYHVDGGSIGTWFARLWKGEYAALITDPSHETPWDSTPCIGISQKLGYVFLRPNSSSGRWEEYQPPVTKEVVVRDYYSMVIHSSQSGEFL